MKAFDFVITDEIGIHARPAGLLVKTAQAYKTTEIKIIKGEKSSDAKKLFGVMGLSVKCGDRVTVTCQGDEEEAAADALEKFFRETL